MGFLDKAKKLADQAQEKLDDVQKQFNEKQGAGSGGTQAGPPPVEYDQHGRPVAQDPEPPHGDPLTGAAPQPAPTEAPAPIDAPEAPADKGPSIEPEPSDTERPQGDPLRDASTSPPKPPSGGSGLTGGDPLAG
jgi:hypothetical protein